MMTADDDLWNPEEVAFLREKEVPSLISDSIITMVRERPADPRAWLSKFFGKTAAKEVRLSHVEIPEGDEASVTVTPAGIPEAQSRALKGTAAAAVMSLANHVHSAPPGQVQERIVQWAVDRAPVVRKQSLGSKGTFRGRGLTIGTGEGAADLDDRQQTVVQHKPTAPQTAVGPVPELVLPLTHSKEPVRMDATSLHVHQVIILVSESGKIQYWNRAAHLATGIPAGSAVGQSIASFLATGSREQLLDDIRKASKPVRRTLDDFEEGMQVWHDNRRDGVVIEITKTGQGMGMVVQYATGDKHKYRVGSVAQGKIRPLNEDRDPPCPQSLNFIRVPFHRVRLELTVRGGPSAGYATLVGIQQRPGDLKSWACEQLRKELGVLVKSTGSENQDSTSHGNAKRAEALLVRTLNADSSNWAPLSLQSLLARLASNMDSSVIDYGVNLVVEPAGDKVPSEITTEGEVLFDILQKILDDAVKATGTDDQSQHKEKLADRPTVRVHSSRESGQMLCIAVSDSAPCVSDTLQAVLSGENKDESVCSGIRRALEQIEDVAGKLDLRVTKSGNSLRVLIPLVPAEEDGVPAASICNSPYSGADLASYHLGEGGAEGISSPAGSLRQGQGRSPAGSPGGGMTGSPGGRRGSAAPAFKRLNLRCTVFVQAAVHRMSLMSILWERSYLLAVANELPTEEELNDVVDLFIVDVHALGADPSELFDFLAAVSGVEVLLLHRYSLSDHHKKQFEKLHYHTAQLPVTGDLSKVLDTIESAVSDKRKSEKEKNEIQKAFTQGISDVPWEKGRMLGRGAFGEVWEANCPMFQGKMAVKIIKLDPERVDEAREKAVLQEVQTMAKLIHDNILRYWYAEKTKDELHIFMELATDGSLKGKVPEGVGMEEEVAAHYTVGILKGLEYLHDQNIVHRDIKADNVLVSRGTPKLCDFGTASSRGVSKALADFAVGDVVVHDVRGEGKVTRVGQDEDGQDKIWVSFDKDLERGGGSHRYNAASVAMGKIQLKDTQSSESDIAGTPHYMSPEILGGDRATPMSDVWATGCLVMELCTGKHPFAHKGSGWMPMKYVSELKEDDTVDLGPKAYTEEARDFLLQCLQFAPGKRPRCKYLKTSAFAKKACESIAKVAKPRSPQGSPTGGIVPTRSVDDPWASDEEGEESESESDGWGLPPEPSPTFRRRQERDQEAARKKEEDDAAWAAHFTPGLDATVPGEGTGRSRRGSNLHRARTGSVSGPQVHIDPS